MDAALNARLAKLRVEGDCCQDLDAITQAARSAPGLDEAVTRYKALADQQRLLALAMVKRSPGLCGCELQAALGLTHATISHHMRQLGEAGLVESERRGKWVHYRLTEAALPLVP